MNKKELKEFIDNDFSIRKIAKSKKVSSSTVQYWLEKYDLRTNNQMYNKASEGHKCLCGETNPDKFYGHKKNVCSKCHNQYNKKKARENKEFIVEYLGGECIKCGYNKCVAAIDIHHLDPSEKDPKFSSLKFRSRKKIIEEIKGCVLLCANCHREEHWSE